MTTDPGRLRPRPVLQDPAELVLAVSVGAPHPAPAVLAEAEVRLPGALVRFQVIGASHLVRVEDGDGRPVLHETLACRPLDAPDRLHRHAFSDRRDHAATLDGYRVAVRFDDPGPLPPRDAAASLEVAFPQVPDGVPLTRVQWRHGPRGLVWTTVHTYPTPGRTQLVTSRSVLALAPRRSR